MPLVVRTYDIDFAGVVSNIVYLRWLEDLRLAVLERCYPLERMLAEGLAPTLVETQIRYLRAIRLQDEPIGHMAITQITRAKFSFTGSITVDGSPTTRAEQVACLVNLETGLPIRLPPDFYDLRAFTRSPS